MKNKDNGRKGGSGYEYLLSVPRDLGKYAGEWVGVVNRKIVAHGRDARVVYRVILKLFPHCEPEIFKVPEYRAMLL
jgi:hypothetical protein